MNGKQRCGRLADFDRRDHARLELVRGVVDAGLDVEAARLRIGRWRGVTTGSMPDSTFPIVLPLLNADHRVGAPNVNLPARVLARTNATGSEFCCRSQATAARRRDRVGKSGALTHLMVWKVIRLRTRRHLRSEAEVAASAVFRECSCEKVGTMMLFV